MKGNSIQRLVVFKDNGIRKQLVKNEWHSPIVYIIEILAVISHAN